MAEPELPQNLPPMCVTEGVLPVEVPEAAPVGCLYQAVLPSLLRPDEVSCGATIETMLPGDKAWVHKEAFRVGFEDRCWLKRTARVESATISGQRGKDDIVVYRVAQGYIVNMTMLKATAPWWELPYENETFRANFEMAYVPVWKVMY